MLQGLTIGMTRFINHSVPCFKPNAVNYSEIIAFRYNLFIHSFLCYCYIKLNCFHYHSHLDSRINHGRGQSRDEPPAGTYFNIVHAAQFMT